MSSSDKVMVFVPACLLCPVLQAKYDSEKTAWNHAVVSFLQAKNISMFQMPCSEATFPHPQCGLNRKPHGVGFYERLAGYSEYARKLAAATASQMAEFSENGYRVLAVLGIEHSPSCAASYIYMGSYGTVHRSGLYLQALRDESKSRGLDIPFIGINRNFPQKAISELDKLTGR